LDRIADQNSHQRAKAMKILEWIACSYRPLKTYEVQDGIFFEPGRTDLNENTKLSISVLDLCRPLVEEGPRHIVNFVHFSAKESVFLSLIIEITF
jgi:hypothetical protein